MKCYFLTPNRREKSSHPISPKEFCHFLLIFRRRLTMPSNKYLFLLLSFSVRGKLSGALLWRCQTLFAPPPPPEVNGSTLSPEEKSPMIGFFLSSPGLSKRKSFTLEWKKWNGFGRYRSYILCWVRMFVKGGPSFLLSFSQKNTQARLYYSSFAVKRYFFCFYGLFALWSVRMYGSGKEEGATFPG